MPPTPDQVALDLRLLEVGDLGDGLVRVQHRIARRHGLRLRRRPRPSPEQVYRASSLSRSSASPRAVAVLVEGEGQMSPSTAAWPYRRRGRCGVLLVGNRAP